MMNRLFGWMLFLLVAACTATPKPAVVEKTTTQYATMDDAWLVPCAIVEPPDQIEYLTLSLEKQKDAWAKKFIEQATATAKCNVRVKQARQYNAKKAKEVTVTTCTSGVCK